VEIEPEKKLKPCINWKQLIINIINRAFGKEKK